MSGGGRVVTTTATGSIARRNYGLNHGYKIDGVKVPGVTTITGNFKSGALAKYPGTATANYAVNNWESLSAMPPADRLKALLAGQFADRNAAAGRGTEVHRVAARIAAGEENVPYADELAGHVNAYRDFLDRLEPKVRAVELIVGNRAHRYCGTLDLIADLGPVEHEGAIIPPARWLLDVRRIARAYGPKPRCNCADTSGPKFSSARNGDERPMSWLEVERCGAIWVRGDGWDLVPLDTGPERLADIHVSRMAVSPRGRPQGMGFSRRRAVP